MFVRLSGSWMRGVERGEERGKGEGRDDRANQCQERPMKKMKGRNRDVQLVEVGRCDGQ